MKKAIAKRWIAALRSGQYKQAQSTLREVEIIEKFDAKTGRFVETHKTNGFCCLGVLCNLHAQAHPRIAKKQTEPGQYLGETAWLPREVMKWAGMHTKDGGYTDENGDTNLAAQNDDENLSFKEIARLIKKHQEEL